VSCPLGKRLSGSRRSLPLFGAAGTVRVARRALTPRLISRATLCAVLALASAATAASKPIEDASHGPVDQNIAAGASARAGGTANALAGIGTNLAPAVDWSTQLPFADLFKLSRNWITQCSAAKAAADPRCTEQWDTGEAAHLDLDEAGWVRSLPAPDDGKIFDRVTTYWALFSEFPAGRYVVLYDGTGKIEYGLAARLDTTASAPGRHLIEISPREGVGMTLTITETDPSGTGDYIRNIRIFPEALLSGVSAGAAPPLFNPAFIDRIAPFRALRFMDWSRANRDPATTWSERPKPGDARWTTHGVPLEIMLALSREASADPWITLAHAADDDMIRRTAETVRELLPEGRRVFVEYSNEVWNQIFAQHRYALMQAKAAWPDAGADDFTLLLNWYGRRSAEICDSWRSVFGTASEAVVCVISAQSVNPYTARQALDCPLWSEAPCTDHGIRALAIAPYFGGYLAHPDALDKVSDWAAKADAGLDGLFTELEQGGATSNSPGRGVIATVSKEVAAQRKEADRRSLTLLAYEGGQHMANVFGSLDEAVIELFARANRDPRMGSLYSEYLAAWRRAGGGLFMNFTDIERASQYGSWGVLEHVGQSSSPKYDALLREIERLRQ
jgi:hypothetical protein